MRNGVLEAAHFRYRNQKRELKWKRQACIVWSAFNLHLKLTFELTSKEKIEMWGSRLLWFTSNELRIDLYSLKFPTQLEWKQKRLHQKRLSDHGRFINKNFHLLLSVIIVSIWSPLCFASPSNVAKKITLFLCLNSSRQSYVCVFFLRVLFFNKYYQFFLSHSVFTFWEILALISTSVEKSVPFLREGRIITFPNTCVKGKYRFCLQLANF